MQCVALLLGFLHALAGLHIFCLVERVTETLASLLNLFLNLLVVFGNLVLNQHVGTIALLTVAVVDEGIVESIHVARGLPDGGVHKNGAVNTHDILVQQNHRLPPILLNVVFQLHTVLTVVINSTQSIVDIA